MNLILAEALTPGRGAREDLTELLRAALLSGQVQAGDPLPSTRVLAQSVRVSRSTVVSVYEDLAGEGYVTCIPGSGTYVAEGLPARRSTHTAPGRPAAAERRVRGAAAAVASSDPRTINLSPGSPDTSFHRNRDWAAAWNHALKQDLPAFPPPPAGDPALRELISQHLRSARGIDCAAEHIIVTAGTSDGLALVLNSQSGGASGLRIATENPGYPAARRVITASGAIPVPIPVRNGGMDIQALKLARGRFDGALITPSHQYPLGGRLPVTARLELLAWASETGARILEDDYDSEFRHGAPPLPAIASLDREGRVVLIGSYSKTLTPWLRCGYLVIADPDLRARAIHLREALGQPVSGMLQLALARFLESGGLRRHLVRTGRAYAHRRNLVLEASSHLAPRFRLDGTEGGLHATISWEGAPEAGLVVARLAERGIQLVSLHQYSHEGTSSRRNGIVFGYGAPTDLQLRRALDEIVTALHAPEIARAPR
ncbi:PLP-dependent aminotransferase family protein [Leucobacter luti]|uniref:MocR-like pyridoxine biosynthesis transcription factor PdxR n=1 Tax=Leucobacter luti TaxID=340320 RepID=UPI001C693BE3|nr:PLP-dependent aminotransferase family protein [Leucobacter luti]QYM75017.1 PLP-dependent aminotransferase family protein [Leucobacter luti]